VGRWHIYFSFAFPKLIPSPFHSINNLLLSLWMERCYYDKKGIQPLMLWWCILICIPFYYRFSFQSMIIALFQIGFPGCIAWGHHTSIVGFDIDTKSHYTPSTTITAIPTGIKILNWFSSIWSSCIHWITPIYFIVGFPFSSSFGGVTGIICANRMIDTPPHDTYFVVGHSHYASPPGAVHTFFAAFYNYTPYFTSYNEFYGRLHFISSFISSSVLSPPLHQLGVNGFPRRTFDYPVTYLRYQVLSAAFVLFG